MANTFEYTLETLLKYIGDGRYAILFLVCLLLGFIISRERDEITFFFQYTLLTMAVIMCPVTADLLMSGLGKKVYWRMMWLIPLALVIAFVLTKFVKFVKPATLKAVLIVAFGALLVIGGNFVYQSGVYKEVQNSYKLTSDTVQIGKMVLRDAGDNEICIALSDNQAAEIRQYSSRFKQPYGRSYDVGWGENDVEKAEKVAEIMQDWHSTTEELVLALADYGCNYVAINKRDIRLYQMHEYGCTEVGQSNSFVVFRLPDDVNPYLEEKQKQEEEKKAQEEKDKQNAEAAAAAEAAQADPASTEGAEQAPAEAGNSENVEGQATGEVAQ